MIELLRASRAAAAPASLAPPHAHDADRASERSSVVACDSQVIPGAAMGGGGSAAGEATSSALELLASSRYAPFRDDAFDPASFASRSLSESHTTAQAQTEQLQLGVASLDGALRQLVLNHQDDLIAQTARLTEAESAVQVRPPPPPRSAGGTSG